MQEGRNGKASKHAGRYARRQAQTSKWHSKEGAGMQAGMQRYSHATEDSHREERERGSHGGRERREKCSTTYHCQWKQQHRGCFSHARHALEAWTRHEDARGDQRHGTRPQHQERDTERPLAQVEYRHKYRHYIPTVYTYTHTLIQNIHT